MDSSEQEMTPQGADVPQDTPEAEPTDLPHTEPAPPAPPPQADPGVYRCVAEIAGEHAILGVLMEGEEYDYSHADPRVLQAVAAYVELGVLEKKG